MRVLSFCFRPAPDEAERISLCKKYDIVWAHGTHTDKLAELVTAAIERFGAEAGCLSHVSRVNPLPLNPF